MDKTAASSELETTTVAASANIDLFYVRRPIDEFTSKNQAIATKRVEAISKSMLKVWIKRFITWEDSNDNWGVDISDTEIVAWFKFKSDAEKCEVLFSELSEKGHPTPANWVTSPY